MRDNTGNETEVNITKVLFIVQEVFESFKKQICENDANYEEVARVLSSLHCAILFPIYKSRHSNGEHPRIIKRTAERFCNHIKESIFEMIDGFDGYEKRKLPKSFHIYDEPPEPKGAA